MTNTSYICPTTDGIETYGVITKELNSCHRLLISLLFVYKYTLRYTQACILLDR